MHCNLIRACYAQHGAAANSIADFLALGKDSFPDRTIRQIKLLSVVYLTRNTLNHSSAALSPADVLRAAASNVLHV